MRRPRPRADGGMHSPRRRTPRLLGVLAGLASVAMPYRSGLAADRRSVGGIPPYARRPRRKYYGSISGVTVMSPGKASPIKAGPIARTQAAVSPTVRRRPPLEPPPQPLFRLSPAPCEPLDTFPGTHSTTLARALTNPCRPAAGARALAAGAGRRRRAPTPEPPCSPFWPRTGPW
jgi:hypothetical protein